MQNKINILTLGMRRKSKSLKEIITDEVDITRKEIESKNEKSGGHDINRVPKLGNIWKILENSYYNQ